MKRTKLTAIFLLVFGSLAMAPLLLVSVASIVVLLIGGQEIIENLPPAQDFLYPAYVALLAILYYAAGYMLLTYHKFGVRLAQVAFIASLLGNGYEALTPSMQIITPEGVAPISGGWAIGYRVANVAFMLFFLWLLKLFDEKQFRSNYAVVSKAQTNLFDHLYGRKRPEPSAHQTPN
jgi:hypothetical protein